MLPHYTNLLPGTKSVILSCWGTKPNRSQSVYKEASVKRLLNLLMVLAVILSSCSFLPSESGVATSIVITAEVGTVIPEGGGGTIPLVTQGPPTALSTLSSGLPITELKYRVLEEFPTFFFCDPDYYPIAHEDESILAEKRFPEIQANTEEYQSILAHLGLTGLTTATAEQKLMIYRQHKILDAIIFELAGDRYRFQIQTGMEGQQGTVITGTISGNGTIDVLQRDPSFPSCPICLAVGTLIDTPRGVVRVENLKVGDPVWTTNEAGKRVSGVLLKTGRVRVSSSHQMVHVTLQDGRELWASPRHPTADGGIMGDLHLSDMLDGSQIIQLELVHYNNAFTFDILPSGTTGYYWANGVLIGSTLEE